MIIILTLFSFILNKSILILGLSTLFVVQIIIEFNFLIFAKKHYGLKMIFFSLFGIQVINSGIIFGAVYFILKKVILIR